MADATFYYTGYMFTRNDTEARVQQLKYSTPNTHTLPHNPPSPQSNTPVPNPNTPLSAITCHYTSCLFNFLLVGCLEGWIRHTNDCYIFMEPPVSWMDAKGECDKIGSHLAIVKEQDVGKLLISRWPEISSSLYW